MVGPLARHEARQAPDILADGTQDVAKTCDGISIGLDEAFCADLDDRLWEALRPATEWTNAFLLPPPGHAVALLAAASHSQPLADAFATNFSYPDRQWAILSSPEATARFIASHA
ncbi:hypothetical protein [Sorangium sp. So ce233]|uniref:hypothetical protein n=1 Tax=Sorangium sp. So ce233 TaxID=3133290 RepID=UPI003F61F960